MEKREYILVIAIFNSIINIALLKIFLHLKIRKKKSIIYVIMSTYIKLAVSYEIKLTTYTVKRKLCITKIDIIIIYSTVAHYF